MVGHPHLELVSLKKINGRINSNKSIFIIKFHRLKLRQIELVGSNVNGPLSLLLLLSMAMKALQNMVLLAGCLKVERVLYGGPGDLLLRGSMTTHAGGGMRGDAH